MTQKAMKLRVIKSRKLRAFVIMQGRKPYRFFSLPHSRQFRYRADAETVAYWLNRHYFGKPQENLRLSDVHCITTLED